MRFVLLGALCGFAACDRAGAHDDTPVPDAGMDAGADGGTEAVRVTVLRLDRSGDPDPDARVVFLDHQGSVLADLAVSPAGVAEAKMPDGGDVLVVRLTDDAMTRTAHLMTFRGVVGGDDLIAGKLRSPGFHGGNETDMSATFSTIGAYDTSEYRFHTACATVPGTSGSTSVTIPFFPGCHGATFDLLAVAPKTDSLGNLTFEFVHVPAATYADGGALTIPNNWTPMTSFTATLSNIPYQQFGAMQHWTMIDHVPVAQTVSESQVGHPAMGVEEYVCTHPAGVGDGTYVKIALANALVGDGQQWQEAMLAGAPSSAALDYSKFLLPWIASIPEFAPTGITWTEELGGVADERVAYWEGEWQDGTTSVTVYWTIVDDGTSSGHIELPSLPTAYQSIDPRLASGVTYSWPSGQPSIYYVDFQQLDGYAASRHWGDNLVDSIAQLGAFVGTTYERRLATHLFAVQPE